MPQRALELPTSNCCRRTRLRRICWNVESSLRRLRVFASASCQQVRPGDVAATGLLPWIQFCAASCVRSRGSASPGWYVSSHRACLCQLRRSPATVSCSASGMPTGTFSAAFTAAGPTLLDNSSRVARAGTCGTGHASDAGQRIGAAPSWESPFITA